MELWEPRNHGTAGTTELREPRIAERAERPLPRAKAQKGLAWH